MAVVVSRSWFSDMGATLEWFCLGLSSLAGLNSANAESSSTLLTMVSILAAISTSKDTSVASGRTSMRGVAMLVFVPDPFTVSGWVTGIVLGRDFMAF